MSDCDLIVRARAGAAQGTLSCAGRQFACALGPAGIVRDKREGDGGTPSGRFALREVFYRADAVALPETFSLPVTPITPFIGWSEDVASPFYNRRVRLPSVAAHESLYRLDSLYDVVIVPGFNDAPVNAGAGSCIFIHLARPGLLPTAGCVALARADMLALLPLIHAESHLVTELEY